VQDRRRVELSLNRALDDLILELPNLIKGKFLT